MSITIAFDAETSGPLSRLKARIRPLLRQGLSRRELALTLALGITLGVLPTPWGATLACALVAAILRLNQVVIQAANYLAYPLQILLFVPFLQLGQRLFGSSPVSIAVESLAAGLRQSPMQTLQSLGSANLKAIGVWALLSPLLSLSLYLLFVRLLRRNDDQPTQDVHE